MTAKEMFEKLGYKYKKDKHGIECVKKIKKTRMTILFIIDDENSKPIFFWYEEYTSEKKWVECGFGTIIAEEIPAINKQIEELGW